MNITIVSTDETELAELPRMLRERSDADHVTVLRGTLERLPAMASLASANLLLLSQHQLDAIDLERLERLGSLYPDTAVVLVSPLQTPEFLLQAMRAGVREVLPAPVSSAALFPAVRRIADKRETRAHADGKVLAFVSCKGGSGATFLATNLGYALSMQEDKRVVLFDLNLQFGDAALFVSDQRPQASLSDVCKQIRRLDPSFLNGSMVNVTHNYSVLAAPEDPAHSELVRPEHIDQLLQLARRQYHYILLDIGRTLDPVSVRALDHADLIFPILQTTLPYIRDGKRLLEVFRSLDYRKEKIKLIVNRHEKDGAIKLADLQQAYDTGIFMTIPNHYEAAAASVNQGVPILKLAKNSPLSKALIDITHRIDGTSAQSEAPGWLAKFFRNRPLAAQA